MILTNCAACAAPLAHTAPRCVRCQTRYCNKTCQARSFGRAPLKTLTNPDSEDALRLRTCLAHTESHFDAAKGVALLERVLQDARRALGDEHEYMAECQGALNDARRRLARERFAR